MTETRFKLTENFLRKYQGKQPSWGFGTLSYFTYKRTYSRLKEDGTSEEFFDTIKRCVEGSFTIQMRHCKNSHLPWDAAKAQKSAQAMFERMWNFKFLPPGRGLWIMGTPIVDRIGSAALNNCFAAETEVITSEGIKQISQLQGTEPTLLTEGGKWVKAPITAFGSQELYKITLSRSGLRKEIFATADHGWFAKDRRQEYRSKGYSRFTTVELRPGIHRLQYCFGQGVKDITPSAFGIAHGITYGDGNLSSASLRATAGVTLCGEKNLQLLDYFNNCNRQKAGQDIRVVGLPNYFKEFPSLEENKSYLYGFLAGYFAADGTVSKSGCCSIESTNENNILKVRELCSVLGIPIYGPTKEDRISNLTNKPSRLWSIVLHRNALTEDFFLIDSHRERFLDNPEVKLQYWTVISVEKTDRKEIVYCATVPGYQKFTLADNILTSNCATVSTKDIDKDFAGPFAWACDMLMLGVGVGYDTLGAGKVQISKCPTDYNVAIPLTTYVIPDSREGWVESIRLLLNNYIQKDRKEWFIFNYDQIRGPGAPIKGFGGTASGPAPLREGHANITKLLDSYDGKILDSVGITDIMNYIGKFVVAGNVRRSAELSMGRIEDTKFIEMKDYTKYPDECADRRWMSNNSVTANPDSNFSRIIGNITKNGEPGIILLENCQHFGRVKDGRREIKHPKYDDCVGVNPCAEMTLHDKEMCCLVETFPANHDNSEDYHETLKYAYLYAKSVTLVPTHCEATNQVMLRNRRIGTSQSGIQQAIKKFGIQKYLSEFCDKGYETVDYWDTIYSRWLGVPTSLKITTIKPSGTISLLAGATPGVHCTHSEFYMRTIRVAANSPLLKKLAAARYRIEPSLTDKNTMVVYFPVRESNFTKSKYDISLWEQLTLVKELQYYWSDNSVSCTITFKPEEVKDLLGAIEYFAPYVKTLSFLPLDNHNYPQAPYQTCTEQEYDEYVNSLGELDLRDGKEESKGERFCTNDSCSI